METNYSNSISFNARFINSVDIRKFNKLTGEYVPTKASFVRVESLEDANVLQNVSDFWGVNSSYSDSIADSALGAIKCSLGLLEGSRFERYYRNLKVYALTTQQANFEHLDENLILGMVETKQLKPKKSIICHIQADSEQIYSFHRTIKGIGSAILESLKHLNNKISLRALSSEAVRHFYIKNGFLESEFDANKFVWEKPFWDKLKNFLGIKTDFC